MSAIPKTMNASGRPTPSKTKSGSDKSIVEKINSFRIEFGPNLKDVQAFTTQLAVMLKAGINIRDAIDAIADQVPNMRFQSVLKEVRKDVEAGLPLSDALARHPKVFSQLYVNMVHASEMSGSLSKMLGRIAEHLSNQVETRSMVRGAMVYPIILGVMAIVTTVFLLVFVLPQFTKLFAGKEALLPKPTIMLMAMSAFMRNQWYIIVGVLAMLGGALAISLRTEKGQIALDHVKLHVPIMSRMFKALYISRSVHTMGELLTAGVDMLGTLEITAAVSGNAVYKKMWLSVRDSVQQGDRLSATLEEIGILPKNVIQMVAAGEESGKLGHVLTEVAEYYQKELRATIKTVTGMIEPIMIILMGFVVGFIAMSIILPIFKMSSLVK
ncbi:MAG: type II secretion system F family protein [Phycisphaerales bacterium]|jgi:type IV pilus assembly protein PilC|nr:type II secretion system F family protein [Phycisphaerales bacterium]